MTEPQGGADPKVFTTPRRAPGRSWVIDGEKWFASHARYAAFLHCDGGDRPRGKAVPSDVHVHRPERIRLASRSFATLASLAEKQPMHAYLRFTNVRVPLDHMLGERRAGLCRGADPTGRRPAAPCDAHDRAGKAVARPSLRTGRFSRTQGEKLSEKQMVQEKIADSWIELEQFRLLVLRTAWLCDKHKDYNKVRKDISAVKAAMPKVLHDIAARALQVHGSLGLSDEMPFAEQVLQSYHMGLADGPVEVHKVTVARQLLRDYQPANTLFPSYHLLAARERAMEKYGAELEPFNHDA